jgi:hypothetical protein
MPDAPANILILGLAKTGSTGLYTTVKGALAAAGHDVYCLFEPTRADQLHSLHRLAPELPLLTKVMIAREPDLHLDHDRFERKVTLLRDPRDMIVSFLLFRPFIRADAPWAQVELFVDAIRAKERDPSSSSVHELHLLADELGLASYRLERVVEFTEWQEALVDRHDIHAVRYEDFVAGRLDDLRSYLDLDLDIGNGAGSSPWPDHIMRSGGPIDWRHWFTEDDVTTYRPALERYMKRFEYADDWELAAAPRIDPAAASGHIEGRYQRRQAQQRQRRGGSSLDAGVADQRERLVQLASDGHSQALYRLARATIDPAEAARLAHRAAAQGHKPAMRLLSEAYRRGRGVPADEGRARFWAEEAGAGERRPGGLRRLLRRR